MDPLDSALGLSAGKLAGLQLVSWGRRLRTGVGCLLSDVRFRIELHELLVRAPCFKWLLGLALIERQRGSVG